MMTVDICDTSSNAFSFPTRSDIDIETNQRYDDSAVQSNPIIIEKCGDLEDGNCDYCSHAFALHEDDTRRIGQDKCVKVDDPRFHNRYCLTSWRHINCWTADHPSITSLFTGSQDYSIILSLFQDAVNARPSLLIGWNELNCADRWMVLQRIFSKNLTSFSPSLGHVVKWVPCNACQTCQSPIQCSWSIIECNQPAMQTVECTMDGCTKQTHHICQIEWQMNTNLEEHTFCCVDCHDGANAYCNLWLNPTTTAPIPSRDRIAQPLPPLNHDGTSGDAGHSPQSRVPRG